MFIRHSYISNLAKYNDILEKMCPISYIEKPLTKFREVITERSFKNVAERSSKLIG